MARSLTAGVQTAIASDSAVSVQLVEMAFSTGTYRFSTAAQDLSWNSQTWVGVGGAVACESVNETGDLSGWGCDIVMSGVNQDIIALILGAQFIGRSMSVRRAFWTASTGLVIADPFVQFAGYMNGSWHIEERRPLDGQGAGTLTVRTRCTDRLAGLDQRRGIQPNLASHQALYSGDRFFQFVGQLAYRNVVWQR